MRRLLNCEIDILVLAAEPGSKAQLPAPPAIAGAVERLIELGLLSSSAGALEITPSGRSALNDHADRIYNWSEIDALVIAAPVTD